MSIWFSCIHEDRNIVLVKVWVELHIVSTLSQSIILGIDFMLNYNLIPNTVNLTAELPQVFNFPLERPTNVALASIRILTGEWMTIPAWCAHAITTPSHMSTNDDYVFSPQPVSRPRLRALKDISPVDMMTSLINTNSSGVKFTNHSEHLIHICKNKFLGQARTLVFRDNVQETKAIPE